MSSKDKKPTAPAANDKAPLNKKPFSNNNNNNNSSGPQRNFSSKFPRNIKPDPAKKDAELEAIQAEVKKLRDEREAITKQIKALRESGRGIGEEKQKLRNELAPIKEALQAARQERDAVHEKIKQHTAQLDLLIQDERKAKEGLGKFSSAEDIDAEIKRREKVMFEGRFTAREEKDMIRDMDKLRLSKKNIGSLQAKQEEVKKCKEARKAVEAVLVEKKAVVEEWQAKFSVLRDALTALDGKDKSGPSTQIPALREKHDRINDKLEALDKKRQQVYDAWKQANADFVAAEEKRRKDEQAARAEEQAKYLQSKEEARLAREAELEKQKPWEAEIEMCDALIVSLARLGGLSLGSESADTAAAPAPSDSAAFAKKEPKKSSSSFGDLKPLTRDTGDDVPVKPKKSSKQAAAAATAAAKPASSGVAPLILDVETLETFAFIGCDAPVLASELASAVEAVKAKRTYYDVLPRNAKPAKNTKAFPAASVEADAPAATEAVSAAAPSAETATNAPPGFSKKKDNAAAPSVKDATLFPTLPGFKPVAAVEEKSTWGPKLVVSPTEDDEPSTVDYNDIDQE